MQSLINQSYSCSYFLLVAYGLCFHLSGCDLANIVRKLESTMIGRAICDELVKIYLFDNDATFLFFFLTCTQVNEFSSFLEKREVTPRRGKPFEMAMQFISA